MNRPFQVEGFLYNVHRYFMDKDSSFFDLYPEMADPVFLPDVTKKDLDLFLSIFYRA